MSSNSWLIVHLKRLCLCAGLAVSCVDLARAQEAQGLFQQAQMVPDGGIVFGVDKITNTFLFTGNADVTVPLGDGSLRWTNAYRSSTFRTAQSATRDNQTAQLFWDQPISPTLHAVLRGAWTLWADDSRSAGLSKLQRLSGAAGLRFADLQGVWTAEGFAGAEDTDQLGVRTVGPMVGVQATVQQLDLEEWSVSGRGLADWHYLDARRTNSDLDLRTDVRRELDGGSSVRVGGGLGRLARQYVTQLPQLVDVSELQVEGRFEQRFDVDADVTYWIHPNVGLQAVGMLSSTTISRRYDQPEVAVPVTAVNRELDEFLVDLQGRLLLQYPTWVATVAVDRYQRNEANVVRPFHTIDQSDLETIRSQEFQRDNQTGRTRLFVQASWQPSERDTLTGEWTSWLLQYDTPSAANDDDRDELQAIATVRYARRISDLLSVGAALSGQYVHFVYLKATRSSLNNVNNVLRFAPFVRIHGRDIQAQPQLEVLANYTVFDFEDAAGEQRSFGFRQVSYRDSVRIRLTSRLRLEAPLLVRYFERSVLQWADFAEIPNTGNLEYLFQVQLCTQPSPAWDVGAGIRAYTLEQRSFIVAPGLPSLLSGVQSIGPQATVRYTASDGSTLSLHGWYEFQTLYPTGTRELPNLLMQARVSL
ncbi:MAG: hypothetical protein ACO3E0_00550 [Candidatus Kapaibacteriota bacterium]